MSKEVRPLTDLRLKTPRAAAVAGILFAILLITANVLIRLVIPPDPADGGVWLEEQANTVALALSLVPIAGIAFLWFIGVVRDRMGNWRTVSFRACFWQGPGVSGHDLYRSGAGWRTPGELRPRAGQADRQRRVHV